MSESINIQEILRILPHRYPLLLVDKVLDYEINKSLKSIKNVTFNEPFFEGHFPGNPIMPGVIILEALAQSGGILAHLSIQPREGYEVFHLFAGIDNARFKQVVRPGDVLQMEIDVLGTKQGVWKVHAKALVDGKLACSADLMSLSKEIEK